jgi:hypothetical protein
MLKQIRNDISNFLLFKRTLRKLLETINVQTSYSSGEFSKRIKKRARTFWQSPDAKLIKTTILQASDPIDKWQNIPHWQRRLSNKYNSREFARLHGCRVARLYWKGREVSEINFNALPAHYVIRPTIGHSCNLVFLMVDGVNLMDQRKYTPQEIIVKLSQVLELNPHYEFLIEEFVKTEAGEYKIPKDYKMYMFNGEIARIEVINRLSPTEGFTSYYDENWNRMESKGVKYAQTSYNEEPPQCLNEIIQNARTLSKAYEIFVRIDFYATNKGAVFGEFTPTPGYGNYFTPAADKMFTEYWNTFCTGKI